MGIEHIGHLRKSLPDISARISRRAGDSQVKDAHLMFQAGLEMRRVNKTQKSEEE